MKNMKGIELTNGEDVYFRNCVRLYKLLIEKPCRLYNLWSSQRSSNRSKYIIIGKRLVTCFHSLEKISQEIPSNTGRLKDAKIIQYRWTEIQCN